MEPINPVVKSDSAKPLEATRDADWANHYWNEYQYRHEKWWHTFYRSIWFIGILGAVPWIPWIKEKFAKEIAQKHVRVFYGLLLLLFLFWWFHSLSINSMKADWQSANLRFSGVIRGRNLSDSRLSRKGSCG